MQLPTAPPYIPPPPSHIHPYTQRRDSPRTDASRHLLQQSRHLLACLPRRVCQKVVFLLRGMAVRAFALIRGVAPGAACRSDACCCRHFFCEAVVFGELLCLSFIGFLAARSVMMCLKGNAMLISQTTILPSQLSSASIISLHLLTTLQYSQPPSMSSSPRMNSSFSRRDNQLEKDDLFGSVPTHFNSSTRLAYEAGPHNDYMTPQPLSYGRSRSKEPTRSCIPTNPTKRRLLFFGVPILLVIVAAAIIGGVVGSQKHHSSGNGSSGGAISSGTSGTSGAGGSNSTNDTNGTTWNTFIQPGSGGDGSVVTTDLGVNFTYLNAFGGTWAQNPYDPYSVCLLYYTKLLETDSNLGLWSSSELEPELVRRLGLGRTYYSGVSDHQAFVIVMSALTIPSIASILADGW